jgi:hypothetical protein
MREVARGAKLAAVVGRCVLRWRAPSAQKAAASALALDGAAKPPATVGQMRIAPRRELACTHLRGASRVIMANSRPARTE